jgi:GLPGLI family protein
MKKIILFLGVLVSLAAGENVLSAQNTEGVVNYDVKIDMHRRIPKERENMKAMMPQFRTEKQQLFFNANESIYKKVEEDSEEDMASTPSAGGGMQIKFMAPKLEVYLDNSSQQRITKQEFMGKEYLVYDTLKVAPWKFGTETKTIQGYECKQAYYTDESRPEKMEVTAWYTDKIRSFLGPERFQTLPGTVLAVDVNNGERVIVAQSIELRPLRKNELKMPSKGIKVTQAEYRAMVDEQMKKMGGNGGFIIKN